MNNRTEIETLAREIADGDPTGLRRMFGAANAPTPSITWAPDADLSDQTLEQRFARVLGQLGRQEGRYHVDDLHLGAFGGMAEWLTQLRRGPDGAVRYTHIGPANIHPSVRGQIGRRPEDIGGHFGVYLAATFRAVELRGLPLLAAHRMIGDGLATAWRRTIVPLMDDSEETAGFVVLHCAASDLRAGLEVVPAAVLIVDAQLVVRHANKAARNMFDTSSRLRQHRPLFEYSGLDLVLSASPEDILRHGTQQRLTCRRVALQRVGSCVVTVSAARHHGTAYYVLMVQDAEDPRP